jgi:hypothetical protein
LAVPVSPLPEPEKVAADTVPVIAALAALSAPDSVAPVAVSAPVRAAVAAEIAAGKGGSSTIQCVPSH